MKTKVTLLFPLIFLVAFIISHVGCNRHAEPDEKTKQELLNKGNEVTRRFSATLMSKVSSIISAKGTVEAIEYCSEHALAITDSLSKAEGVHISRVSHRNRNPSNAANDRESELIEKYLAQLQGGVTLEPVIVSDRGKYVYYSPILITVPACLKCHGNPGSDIEPAVAEVLRERYPADKATGFGLGELRGMFRVEFDNDRL